MRISNFYPKYVILHFLILNTIVSIANTRENPTPVKVGINTSVHVENEDCWFVYQSLEPKKIKLTTCGLTEEDTYIEVYTQNVEEPFIRNDHSCKQQAEAEFFANPDSTYLIRWRGIYIENDYEWRCSESSADQGSHYSIPLDLKLVLDSVVVPSGEERWFKYTSEDDAVIEVITKFSKFKIFKGVVSADKLLTDRHSYPDTLSFFSQAGESFYLCFYRTWNEESAFVKWEINKRVPEQGESPLTAMALPLDQEVSSDNDFKGEKWYHFKSDTSGILSFKYDYYFPPELKVIEADTGGAVELIYNEDNWEGPFYELIYDEDKDYYIAVVNLGYFSFSAKKKNYQAGEVSFFPIRVEPGLHYAKTSYGTGQWFEYIPESDNHLVIATEKGAAASSTILLYEKEDMLLVASDSSEYDYGHICELNYKVQKDVSYLIYIGNYSNSTLDGFNWDLREGFQSCDIDLTMMEQFVPYNLSGNTEYWFEFEAPYNCEAIINASDVPGGANVDIQIFSDCDSPLTNPERGTASALVGEKSKILIKCRGEKVSGSYKVELSLVNKPLGSYEFPLEAVKGENTVQPGITWFYYVSDSDCKVELTELAGEGGITKFDVYRYRNGNIYRSTTSNTFRKAAYRSDANKRVLIKIEYNGLQEGINWLLEEKDFEEGDVISLALKVEDGINLEDKCNRMPSFYYYVPEQDGELTVSTCELTGENTSFYVLDSINQVSTALFDDNYCGLQSQLSFDVIENDTIYIVWYEDNTNVPYEWKIENNVFGLGEHRKEPKEAIVGLNESDFTESKDQWFTYKATVNGRIRLSSCEVEATFSPDIKVYESNGGEVRISKSTSCGWNKYEVLFQCVEGVSYDIQFDVYSIDPDRKQDWILEEIAYEPGEKCYYPKEAFEGVNNAISRKTKWFSYTATDNCELSISRCGIDGQENYGYSLYIYLNCDQRTYRYDYESCDIGRKYTIHAHKDSTYLFNWIGTDLSDLQWNLDVSIYEESGFCEDAKVANEGINKIEFNGGHTWYFFKPDRDGRIHIDSRGFSNQDTYLIFYDGCSDGLTNTRIHESDSYYGDEAYISCDVIGGQTYYICWRGDKITDDYEWELRFDPKGDSRELPLSVEIGANHRVASEINQQFYDLSLHSGQSGLYEISLPQSANAKIEVLDNNPHPYMFNYNDDSTKLDINNSWALSYKLKITSDSGDAFDWLLEQKHMDTIRVEDETSVHSDFFMDWFKLKDPIDGYVMLESDKPISAADDITLLNSYDVILPFKSPEQSAVFKVNENWDYTLNWKNSSSANDYYWGFKSIEFDTNTKCFDGYKAKEGINKLKIDARSYWYKLSIEEDGNYLIKGKLPDGYDIDIYNLSMYEGNCNGVGINDWYTEDMFVAERDSFILRIDSLKSANYYLNWNFKVGEDQIVPFEWELKMTEAIRIGINHNYKNDRAAYVDNNPNRGIFNVHVDERYLNGVISLYNLSGAIINRKEIINTCIFFDESELPSGVYLLIVRNGDKESSLKVIIR